MTLPLLAVAIIPGTAAVWLWALKDLQRFVLLGVLSATVVPVAIVRPAGAQVAIADLLLLVALCAWLVTAAVRTEPLPQVRGNPLLAPLLVFVLVNAASMLWTVDARETLEFVVQLTEIVLVFSLVFATLPRDLGAIRAGLLLFVVTSGVLALVASSLAVPQLIAGDYSVPTLNYGLNKNAVGSYVAAGLVVSYTFGLRAPRGKTRRWLVFAVCVESLGLLSASSRGAIIGASVSLLAITFLLRTRRLATLAAVVVASSFYLAVLGTNSGAVITQAGGYESGQLRVYSFENAVEKIKERPLLGTGAGTYVDELPQIGLVGTLPDPNNMFLLTWAEIGVFGFGALLFLFQRFLALWLRMRELPQDAAVIGVAAGGVSLSLLVHFQFDVTWTRGTSSLAFAAMGMMVAAGRLAAPRQAAVLPVPVQAPLVDTTHA